MQLSQAIWDYLILYFCQPPVLGLGLGVDFVFPLSQEEEQEEQEQEPSPKSLRMEGTIGL